jgi:hypothetical protein
MADIRLLERTLQQNVAWNCARLNFVAKFVVVIQVHSVNLSEAGASPVARLRRPITSASCASCARSRCPTRGGRAFVPKVAWRACAVGADARPHRLVSRKDAFEHPRARRRASRHGLPRSVGGLAEEGLLLDRRAERASRLSKTALSLPKNRKGAAANALLKKSRKYLCWLTPVLHP